MFTIIIFAITSHFSCLPIFNLCFCISSSATMNMNAYTGAAASQLKNFGDLSTTAVGNIKSFAGNLVNRRNQN